MDAGALTCVRRKPGFDLGELVPRQDVLEARADTIPPSTAAQLRVFKQIVCMRPDVLDVTLPATAPPNWEAAATRLHELGAHNSAERVAARASAASS